MTAPADEYSPDEVHRLIDLTLAELGRMTPPPAPAPPPWWRRALNRLRYGREAG